MCGRFNVRDNQQMRGLMVSLRIDEVPDTRLNIAPGAIGQFVIGKAGHRSLVEGYWSLMIEPRQDGRPGFRPNPKFKTFNARSDRLEASPLWRVRYHCKRAIIPVSGYHEWRGKQCYEIEQEGRALALAGLYDIWEFDGELVPAFSVITLPPHPKLSHIHEKSIPLMLEQEDFDRWLDPDIRQTDSFRALMTPVLNRRLLVMPIESPATLHPIPGPDVEILEPDSPSGSS